MAGLETGATETHSAPVMSGTFAQNTDISEPEIMLGISGNSGTGKTTAAKLCQVLVLLTEAQTIQHLEGDGAHLYPRGDAMREQVTHLNPAANNLEAELVYLLSLKRGETVFRREYDHHTGTFTDPLRIEPHGGVVVYTGLHALYEPEMREVFDISIFVEPDEALAMHQKIVRDQRERGHPKEKTQTQIERRAPDKAAYIDPQGQHADIVLMLYPKIPIAPEQIGDPAVDVQLNVKFKIKEAIDIAPLFQALEKVTSLTVVKDYMNGGNNRNILNIGGSIRQEDLTELVLYFFPDRAPRIQHFPLEDGLNGLIQLVALYVTNQKLQHKL